MLTERKLMNNICFLFDRFWVGKRAMVSIGLNGEACA